MSTSGLVAKSVGVIVALCMILSAIPCFSLMSLASDGRAAVASSIRVATHNVRVVEYNNEESLLAVEETADMLNVEGGSPIMASPSSPNSPRAAQQTMYSDSAVNNLGANASQVTGAPDDIRFSISGSGAYVRASGSNWDSGSGTIVSVEIAAEWIASGLSNDGALLRYYDDAIAGYGATTGISDTANYATDNLSYINITADKASWTWAMLDGIYPEMSYKVTGGSDGGTISTDALWLRVQYDGTPIQFSIPVSTGWRLISVPLAQSNTDILTVLNDTGGDTAWDYAQHYTPTGWKSYATFKPSAVNDLLSINNEMGIWVYITNQGSDAALRVSGLAPTTANILLRAGWNLVGYPCLEEKMVASALAGVPYEAAEKFDASQAYRTKAMLSTEYMSPGNGYWIKVSSDCTWTIGDTTPPTFAGLVSATDSGTGGAIDLTWSAATDPSYPITYNIYQAASSGGQNFATPSYTSSATSYHVTGLTNGQPYYFVVRAKDSAGNIDTNSVERSATPTAPDTVQPYIIDTIPANGATGVSIGQSVIITFSESINTGSFTYSCSPNPGGWGQTFSTVTYPNDRVTLTHNIFAYSTAYTFQVTAANDLAGNALTTGSVPNPWSFTTVAAPDTTGPIVSGVSATPNPVVQGNTLTLTATVSDATTGNSNVVAAEWSRGASAAAAGSGTAMSASDGNFNSPTEGVTASMSTAGWSAGANTLWVRGRDAAGNWGGAVSTSVDVTIPDTTSPQIITTVPASGATGVAITQSVIITFSESINTGSFTYTCTPNPGGWSATWSTVIYTNDRVTLTHTSFAYGTSYTFTVTAANDLAGNGLAGGSVPNPWGFMTVAAPDTTGPIVSGVSAIPNPVVQGNTLTLTATVSDATTGNSNVAAAEWSRGASAAAAGSGTAMSASDGNFNSPTEGVTASMSTAGWPAGTNTLWVRGRDAAGNWGNAVSTNVDVTIPDTTPPQVVSNTPADGATGVAIATNIVVTFNEEMNKANTEGAFSTGPATTGVFTWNAAGTIMTYNPNSDLSYSTTYAVTITTAATDLAGNTLDGDKDGISEADNKDKWVFSFTTAAEPDTTSPYITATTPTSGASGVAITQSVIITFSESINTGSFTYTCTPNPGGWSATWSTVTYTNDRVTLTHTSFAYSTSYTFTVTAANDLAGNSLTSGPTPNPWSFTTQANPDGTGPVVSGVTGTPNPIAQGATLTLTATVSDATTGNSNVAAAEWSRGASAAAAGSGTAMSASDGNFNSPTEGVTASMSTTGWPAGTNTLWVRGRDSVGNWGSAVSTTVTVTVPDITPPQVESNTPANGATGVVVTTNIVVDFNEAMNQANTQGAFEISPTAAGAFSWNAGGDIMTFNPTSDLVAGTTYTVTVHTTATDLAGNTLDGDKDGVSEADNKDMWVFSFTTAGGGSVNKYAVCVGINKYTYLTDLTYCVNDANECDNDLTGAGYSVDKLTDTAATRTAILTALNDMGTSEVTGDYTAFTYSGHGGILSGKCIICPTGYDGTLASSITKDDLESVFSTYQSAHQLIFFDSCQSGGMSALGSSGRLCIMACASNQYSWDGQSDIANGVWTYYFWEDGYRLGGAGSTVLETVFTYAKPLASDYVAYYYGDTMTPQIADGYTGSFYL